ncbi:MAG: hypothetical protein AAF212_06845 [Verrucomicrobiota bacterium]
MEFLYNTQGPLGRQAFVIRLFVVILLGAIVSFALYQAGYYFLHFETVGIFWAMLGGFFFGWAAIVQLMRRLRDLDIPAIFAFVPVYNLYVLLLAFTKAGKSQ